MQCLLKKISHHTYALHFVAFIKYYAFYGMFFYLRLCVLSRWKQIGLVRYLFTVLKDRGHVALAHVSPVCPDPMTSSGNQLEHMCVSVMHKRMTRGGEYLLS